MPLCRTESEVICMANRVLKIRSNFSRAAAATGCLPPCVTEELVSQLRENPEYSTGYAKAFLEVESSDVAVVEEYLVFDFNDIISSVGGALGLFLGFSCFQMLRGIIDLAEGRLFAAKGAVQWSPF